MALEENILALKKFVVDDIYTPLNLKCLKIANEFRNLSDGVDAFVDEISEKAATLQTETNSYTRYSDLYNRSITFKQSLNGSGSYSPVSSVTTSFHDGVSSYNYRYVLCDFNAPMQGYYKGKITFSNADSGYISSSYGIGKATSGQYLVSKGSIKKLRCVPLMEFGEVTSCSNKEFCFFAYMGERVAILANFQGDFTISVTCG